jgi:hypothetical protein
MDAKSRAWQRLQAELKDAQPETKPPAKVVVLKDPKKQTLLTRLQRLADASLAKQDPEPEAA